MFSQGFQAYTLEAASDEITWKKPRTILVVIAWSVTCVSILLNVFLSGIRIVGFAFWSIATAIPIILLFLISIFAGMLLEDTKSIVLGVFETIALTILLTYAGMTLPALIGNAPSIYVEAIYTSSMYNIFSTFFPLIPLSIFLGAVIGGFIKEWLS